ncbi:hypothetical protein L3i22_008940 [Actinoplanes sp. L3-i22]|nr:hypothetical protein L3i22_008940 [Actinoplanes sp. L3-i22]
MPRLRPITDRRSRGDPSGPRKGAGRPERETLQGDVRGWLRFRRTTQATCRAEAQPRLAPRPALTALPNPKNNHERQPENRERGRAWDTARVAAPAGHSVRRAKRAARAATAQRTAQISQTVT